MNQFNMHNILPSYGIAIQSRYNNLVYSVLLSLMDIRFCCGQVETDLAFLGGKPVITVLEGQLGKYELTALPKKRGRCNGAVAFVAGKNPLV